MYKMITRVLTHFSPAVYIVILSLFGTGLHAQNISYSCGCQETLPDGVIEFKITGFGVPGDVYEISNAVNLFTDAALSTPIIDATMIPDVNDSGRYCISGFASDGILPTADVFLNNGAPVELQMITCMTPEVEIRPEEPEPATLCVGSLRRFCIEDLFGTLTSITWSAPGSASLTQVVNDRCADIEYDEPGTYIISVEGETRTGCEFSSDLIVFVEDMSDDLTLTGDNEIFACDGLDVTETFTLEGTSGATEFKLMTVSPAGALIPFMTATGSGTGSGMGMVAGTFTFPAVDADFVLVACNANTAANSCDFSVQQEITVRTELDNVDIIGPSCTCLNVPQEYTIANSGDFTGIGFSVSPGVAGVDYMIAPMGGQSTVVDITFLTDGVFTVTATGTADAGDNIGCNFTATTTVDVTASQNEFVACNNLVNVSLNNNCELDITPDMILEGDHLCNDAYTLVITDAAGNDLTGSTITQDQLGETLNVSVEQICGANSCWGQLVVEDKSITPLTCPDGSINTLCSEFDQFADFNEIVGLPLFDMVLGIYRPTTDDFVVTGHDNCSDVIMTITDVNNNDDCSAIRDITRTFSITDVSNGAMSSCSVNLQVVSQMTDAIIWPKNWDSALDPALATNCPSLDACNINNPDELLTDTYTLDQFGNPDPSSTGFPEGLLCSNLSIVGYVDAVIPGCGPAVKILRTWTVYDECTMEQSVHTQIITLEILEPTVCIAGDDQFFETSAHSCTNNITVPPPTVLGGCTDFTYTVSFNYVNGVLDISEFITDGVSSDAVAITDDIVINNIDFTFDSIWVRYIVQDMCGNELMTDGCILEGSLNDTRQPIPACDLNNVVSLNESGCAFAGPATFDDNSWDNCGIYQTVIQRMDFNNCNSAACNTEDDCALRFFDDFAFLGEFTNNSGDTHYYYLSDDAVEAQLAFAYANALGEDRNGNQEGALVVLESAEEDAWLQEQVGAYTNDPIHTAATHALYLMDTGGPDNFEGRFVVEFTTRCGWTQQEMFCCADCGEETRMMLRVIDNAGNHNFCMVNVKVEDFIPPTFTSCPQSMTVDCNMAIDFDNLGAIFGMPSASDFECSNPTITLDRGPDGDPRDECGRGSFTRTWSVVDKSGNQGDNTCSQTITFTNPSPFAEADIIWPNDAMVTSGCSLDGIDSGSLPQGSQRPVINERACSNVVVKFDDLLFTIVEGACQKLVRTWSVADWCNPGTIFTFDQVIRLTNTSNPIAVCPGQPLFTSTADCSQDVSGLTSTIGGGDACTSSVVWTHQVTLADGSVIFGDGATADGNFDLGTHQVTFTVSDACDNTGSCTTSFTVRDTGAPVPYCQTNVVTPISTVAGVEVWTTDIDLGSEDACSSVQLSFSESTIVNSISFNCDNIGINNIELFVIDEDNNVSSCRTSVIVQDNIGVCPNSGNFASVAGVIMTEDERMIDEVEVDLMSAPQTTYSSELSVFGEYAFYSIPMYNDYQVIPEKDKLHENGVNTLDLIMIQRHILGLQPLNSPYKIIAADVNNSQSVDGADLVELRKLILGVYLEFPQNESWRFVDADFTFNTPTRPWPFAENVNIRDLENNMNNIDFVGVKIGDVNLSSVVNGVKGQDHVDLRSPNNFNIVVRSMVTEKGNTRVQLVATEAAELLGAQLNFDFDASDLLAIVPMALDVQDKNIGWNLLKDNKLRISWNQQVPVSVQKDEVLMEFLFNGANENLKINEDVATEVYTEEAGRVRINSVQLEAVTSESIFDLVLEQNKPNPFKNATTIGFSIPQDGPVSLIFTDVDGKLIKKINGNYRAGHHEVVITGEELITTGVVYYQLSAGSTSITKRMIILK